MNKQPVYYLQTDARWKSKPYQVKGETATIGGSGCGPSCAAMLIETLTQKTFTPEDACNWSMTHGYKALNQGTYYSYFKPQFAEFGIDCEQLNGASLYGNAASPIHATVEQLLKDGWYIIACMGPGTWTSSGHFVVLWWEDGKMRINDPASTSTARTNGDIATFKKQVKYYWKVDARSYNVKPLDVTGMDAAGTVTATTLNVRSGPGTSYSIIGTLSKDNIVMITGTCDGWYQIISGKSDSAWVSAQYIAIVAQKNEQEEIDMTKEEVQKLVNEAVDKALAERDKALVAAAQTLSDWAKEPWEKAVAAGVFDGTVPGDRLTREQAAVVLDRLGLIKESGQV